MLKRTLIGSVFSLGLIGAALVQPALAQTAGGVANAVIQPEPPGLMLGMVQNGPTQMVAGNSTRGCCATTKSSSPCPASPRAGR